MFKLFKIFILLFAVTSCQSQTRKTDVDKMVGGPCEGCEAVFEYGSKKLTATDTLPGFENNKPKINIVGTVFKKDGKTPAPNIILYFYHTNRKGIYEKKGDEKGWGQRHGYIRTWLKTDAKGNYSIYSFRPASYPNRQEPEHIHITVKELGYREYYIDDIMFADDPKFINTDKQKLNNRAGSGVVALVLNKGILTARRDIILGLNIPDYD